MRIKSAPTETSTDLKDIEPLTPKSNIHTIIALLIAIHCHLANVTN